eukprot:CAMPEP_0194568596 /NCGR_PEP_ID=MMETSP0292-20121207/6660_1 /TAXON_ID=39354 /ORGANISM="Heterosigma akashiwo, Strain CCMP2393" /LENGTH=154 /DNA_ID=CAMNT_0039418701 /DNA_START=953 /DNA_END=1417 /DNA_ORIENTATION=-
MPLKYTALTKQSTVGSFKISLILPSVSAAHQEFTWSTSEPPGTEFAEAEKFSPTALWKSWLKPCGKASLLIQMEFAMRMKLFRGLERLLSLSIMSLTHPLIVFNADWEELRPRTPRISASAAPSHPFAASSRANSIDTGERNVFARGFFRFQMV